MKKFRYYQSEADCAIHKELLINNKCIVKMFCGTGKSLLMRKCQSAQGHALLVYVFPSLSLIDQFHTEYLHDFSKTNVLKISSESEATTHPKEIKKFLSKKHKKIICITYQSYETLLENLGDIKINMCIFDEAHHAVGNTYQKLIFENNLCEKQIFFTATPKNTNGIVMYDRNNLDEGMCGALVYDYSYLRGLNDNDETGKQILNAFEIRVDMYTENINSSVYESIARAILVSGNNRILTFHSDVNTERDTSVNNFVDESSFKNAFMKVLEEFPEKAGVYINFKMIALDASIKMNDRRKILDNFDTTLDSDVYIISSCETIGEGIDTKNANMCVFVDPKTSFVKIIQNLGRVLRPQASCSTILIPCWVNKEKYIDCEEDREKCDAVIRSDISEGGNFNGILNVMSALKQEDEDIYDICLHYPDTYSPQEITSNLEKHGYNVMEQVCDGSLLENIDYLLDTEIDYEECDTDEELIIRVAEKHNICIEIYTHSLENPVETYNSECKGGKIIRLYKDDVYYPIVKKCGKKKNCDKVKRLDRKNRIRVDVHTNPEVKVLWRLMGDFTKEICSCVLDCEIVKYDPMEVAQGIVSRKNQRPNLIPRHIIKGKTPELKQENIDSGKLGHWKAALKKNQKSKCSDEVRDYLDKELSGWRDDLDAQALKFAQGIVSRKDQRPNLIPRHTTEKTTLELKQENKDAVKLGNWKSALNGTGKSKCSDEVRDYLDKELPGWRTETDLDAEALQFAEEIVSRKNQRPNLIPRHTREKTTPELKQEGKDAQRLSGWKNTLNRQGKGRCSDEVRDYLDKELPGWRTEKKSMKLNEFKEPPSETPEQKKQRLKTELEILHQRYKTLNSQNLQKEFQGNPELWHTYHSIAETNEQSFPEEAIPRNRIIQELNKIKSKRAHSIVDMGCGKAQIAKHFQNDTKFQFINYDHISENDSVISCDISQIPLEEHTVEICILSLAMWGSNCHDYVREAHRILESGGKLYIIEATRRWSEKDENGNIIPGKEAIKLKKILEETGFQIIKTHIEKFSLFVCIKV